MLDPYERITWRDGRLIDRAMANALMDVEDVLGYKLTVLQAVGGAPASNGFHLGLNGEGGRAVDLTPNDGEAKDHAMKDCGFIGWGRDELPGVWAPHRHYVLVLFSRDNRRGIAPGAFDQIAAYDRREDGLVGSGMDLHSYRADPKVVYTRRNYREDTAPPMNDVEKMRDSLLRAKQNIATAIAHAKAADGRKVIEAQIPWLKEKRAEIDGRLDHLPLK